MALLDPEKLKQKVLGRKQADDIFELIDLKTPEAKQAFLKQMGHLLLQEAQSVEKVERQRKLHELSAVVVEFGQYRGSRLDSIPRDYLHWYVGESESFVSKVVQYLEMTKDQDKSEE